MKKQLSVSLILICIILWGVALCSATPRGLWILGPQSISFLTQPSSLINVDFPGFGEANATVCDSQGQLLFATDGSTLLNRNGQVMLNGRNLTGYGDGATGSTSQGALAVPVPGSEYLYYVFSLTSVEMFPNDGKLFYSLVDMRLDGGLGGVVPSQKGKFLDSGLNEKMTAIEGAKCNIWVIVSNKFKLEYKAFSVTKDGIETTPVLSHSGNFYFSTYRLGEIYPSPDRKKMVVCAATPAGGGLELLDFDNFTGKLSHPQTISDSFMFYTACFSPDGTKVYGKTYFAPQRERFFQFDISVPNSPVSYEHSGSYNTFDKVRLGADGKVYVVTGFKQMGAISLPNNKAPGDGFNRTYFEFDIFSIGAFPNYVPYVRVPDSNHYNNNNISAACWANEVFLSIDSLAWDVTWEDGSLSTNRRITKAGVYLAHYFTRGCVENYDTFHVDFSNGVLPQLSIQAACKGQNNGAIAAKTYDDDPVTYHYNWRDAHENLLDTTNAIHNLSPGTYSVQITTDKGCDTTLYVVLPSLVPDVDFKTDKLLYCVGDRLTAQNLSGTGYTHYFWYWNDSLISSSEDFSLLLSQPGKFLLSLVGHNTICADTISSWITIDARLGIGFDPSRLSLCQGESVLFTPDTDSTVTQYYWHFGSDYYTVYEKGSISHAFDEKGNWPVTLTTRFRACPDTTDLQTIVVYPIPKVNLGADTSLCFQNGAIHLFNRYHNTDYVYLYQWSTGATSAAIEVLQPGNYSLKMADTVLGCTGYGAITITKDCYLDIPNAFSPNGDGVNDYFFPRALLMKSATGFTMQVFNRWGQIVFVTHNKEGRGWDGTWNDTEQPAGVYVYRIEVQFENGYAEIYNGNLTVLR